MDYIGLSPTRRPAPRPRKTPGRTVRHARRPLWPLGLAGVLLAVVIGLVIGLLRDRPRSEAELDEAPVVAAPEPVRPVSSLAFARYPTEQTRLLDPVMDGVFMHTGGGDPRSGTFGSVRTGSDGLSRFHEGIDIAPLQRDARGRALDPIVAVADGRVVLTYRSPGGSDYGNYVVVRHDDPVGDVFTLYSHMASIEGGLSAGVPVARGQVLGVMGNTASDPIPMARAHLHFEFAMMLNSRFLEWDRKNRKVTPGGLFNGLNLFGMDPLVVFRAIQVQEERFEMTALLRDYPVGFELAIKLRKKPDFFVRHPALWTAGETFPCVAVLSVADSGLPLRARTPTNEEATRLGTKAHAVVNANPTVLGRNGRRIVIQRQGNWVIGPQGERWLSLLTF